TITSPRLIPTRNSILLRRGARVALGHAPLHLRGAPHGINHARELGKEAVARILHDPPPVLGDLRLDQVPEVRFQPLVRPPLIRARWGEPAPRHQPARLASRSAPGS